MSKNTILLDEDLIRNGINLILMYNRDKNWACSEFDFNLYNLIMNRVKSNKITDMLRYDFKLDKIENGYVLVVYKNEVETYYPVMNSRFIDIVYKIDKYIVILFFYEIWVFDTDKEINKLKERTEDGK